MENAQAQDSTLLDNPFRVESARILIKRWGDKNSRGGCCTNEFRLEAKSPGQWKGAMKWFDCCLLKHYENVEYKMAL